MKKLIAAGCITLILTSVAFAQKNEKPKVSVIWSPDPNCHQNNSAEVKALEPKCSIVAVDRTTFFIVEYGGISYAMTHRPSRGYLVASVQISNKSEMTLQVNPMRSRIVRFKSVEDLIAESAGDSREARSQDDLRRASYRESAVSGERDGEIRSGLRVQETYEGVYNRGRVVGTITRVEPATPASSNPTPAAITNTVLVPRAVFDYVMRSRALARGEKVAGHIVFENPDDEKDKRQYILACLNAGHIEFVFPIVAK